MRFFSVCFALALVGSSIACSSSSSEPVTAQDDSGVPADAPASETPAEAGPKCGGFTTSNAKCQSCLESSCCAAAAACGGDAACVQNLRDIRAATKAPAPTATDAAKALDACMWKSCSEQCGGIALDNVAAINHRYKSVGDPCSADDNCLTGICSIAHQCTRTCADDTDCAGYPDVDGKAAHHVCVQTKSDKQCLPSCEVQADCDKLVVSFASGLSAKTEPLTCADVGGSHKACILARDAGPTPACYPGDSTLGGFACTSNAACICGTSCDGHACTYSCTDNASCTTQTHGLYNLCFSGSDGTKHCG